MRLYELHVEHPKNMFCNANVFAGNETEALDKFKRLFNLDSGESIRIKELEVRGIIVF